jgi:hypothetical protein
VSAEKIEATLTVTVPRMELGDSQKMPLTAAENAECGNSEGRTYGVIVVTA